ncbi:MAG: site-2 protease family protein [Parcubacteria group bacterium]|jgi:Zn-dependent protease|nr:site-2 protease family protein [Parcubacteria group bacterium]|tara:strand:+ start:1229 stop:1879 length:651 start_codon:yes stop_codon:yes gene_type:complete
MEGIIFLIFIVTFILAVIFHEVAHGWVANYFGDDTARISGRLSLNPIVHIDPIGSILVPVLLWISSTGFLFGWAKPVPVNPHRLRGGAQSYRLVTMAGIFTNLVLAVVAALVLKLTTQFLSIPTNNLGVTFFTAMLQINLVLAVFNSLPLPGFDGFNFLTTFSWFSGLVKRTPLADPMFMARYGLFASILLIFLFMPFIGAIFSFVFGWFILIFGL